MARIRQIARPWTQQPQEPVSASQEGASAGLAFLWAASSLACAVTGRLPSAIAAEFKPAPDGIVAACSTGQTNVEWADFAPIVTSNGVGTGDFAMLVVANPVQDAGLGHVLAQKNDAGGSPYAQACMVACSTDDFSDSSVGFAFVCYSSPVATGVSVDVIDGAMHVFVGVRRGVTLELWVDGLPVGTATASQIINILQSNRYIAIGSRGGGGTTNSFGRDVLAAGAWNIAPSPDLLSRMRRPEDVWQLFAPLSAHIPTSAAGGGLPTLSAATYMPGSLTSVGFRPRVTAS